MPTGTSDRGQQVSQPNPIADWIGGLFRPAPASAPAPAPPPAPPIDFGSPRAPESNQRLTESLLSLAGQVGGGGVGSAPQLPQAPTITADPGLTTVAEHQASRNEQVQRMLTAFAGRDFGDDPRSDTRMQRFGQWLSAVSADPDGLANSGNILAQQERERSSRIREIEVEAMRLQMAGFPFEDAMVQAQANVLSGTHAAAQQTDQNRFQRDVAQTELGSRYAFANADAGARSAQARAGILAQAAQSEYEGAERGRERWEASVGGFLGDPQHGTGAARALASETFGPGATADALGSSMMRQRAEQGLLTMLRASGTDSRAQRTLANTLREFDPGINRRYIEQNGVQAAFFRALQSPNADAVFARHPEWARLAPYASGGEE